MKPRSLFAAFALVPLASGAVAAVLGACGTDDFAAVDSGAEGGDVTVDVANDVRTETGTDAGPKGWCAVNAPVGAACADFDDVDAASALAPTWFVNRFNNAGFTLGAAPDAAVLVGAAPSPPQQLLANAGIGDGGAPGPLIVLSAAGIAAPAELTLDFSFLASATTGGAGQVVEFARVDVVGNPLTDSLTFSLAREGSTWQIRGSVVTSQIKGLGGDPIPAGSWHRISLTLKKAGSNTYALAIDGTAVETSTFLKPWPNAIDGTYGRIGATEMNTIDTPVKAYFDNVVWHTK